MRLNCSADSVLGTTAYVIARAGLDEVLAEHRRVGYVRRKEANEIMN